MRLRFRDRPVPRDEATAILAARADALHQIIRGVVLVAFLALVAFAISGVVSGDWSYVPLYAALFGVLVVLAALPKLSVRLRGGTFVALIYALAVLITWQIGIGGAGRVFFVAFAVLVTAIFGAAAGMAAAVLSLATWFSLAAAFSFFGLEPIAPSNSAAFFDWVSAGTSMLMIMVALMIPQRQFLSTRLRVFSTAREMAELTEARARLAEQAAALQRASADALEANRQLAEQARLHERRAALLALSAEVAHAAAGVHDVAELLQTSVNLVADRFNYYHAGLFLVDDAREWAVLRAANSPGGQRMLARAHRLRVGLEGIVGFVTGTGQPRIALDVGADAIHFANPDLPDTHSEAALPISARGVLIGALDVQSVETNAFTAEDVRVLQTLADQIGVAIDNARLFEETRRRLAELQALQSQARQVSGLASTGAAAFRYDGVDVQPLPFAPAQAAGAAAHQVPLQFGDQPLGILEVKRAGEALSAEDQELTAAIAERMALALESAQAFESTRARARQLASLSEVSLEFSGPQFQTDVLVSSIARAAQRLFGVDGSGVWLPAGGDEIELKAEYGSAATGRIGGRLQRAEGLAGRVFALGRTLRVDDYPRWSGLAAGFADVPFHAALAVPMAWQGQLLGVLTLTLAQPGRQFTADDEHIAQLFAAQAASTLENARLFAQTQARLNELATINAVSQSLTSQLDLRALVDTVGEQVTKAFGRDALVALYDAQTNLIEIPYFTADDGTRETIPPFPLGQGLTSHVIQTRRPLLINHDAERAVAELGAKQQGRPARSWLGVPIPIGDEVAGVISVQDLDQDGLFGDDDIRLLTTIAASVGVAIQNARLFSQTQRRAEELAAINLLSQALSSQLALGALSQLVVERLCQTFAVDSAYLALYDGETDLVTIPYAMDEGRPASSDPFPLGRGLTSLVINSRQPLLINHDAERRVAELGAFTAGRPARSFLAVPVLSGSEVLGAISIQDTLRDGRFADADVRLLSTIAANVGVAVQNARLFEQTQQRAAELAVVNELARAISEQLEPTQVLQTVYDQIQRIVPLDGFFVTLYDHQTGLQSTPLIYDGGRRSEEGPRPLPARGLIRQVIETGQAVLINRTAEEVERIALSPEVAMGRTVHVAASLLYLPLHFGQQVGGVLSVQSVRPNAYRPRHQSVLAAVANHVVVALQNARLFEETERRAEQLGTAAEVARATTSVLTPGELIVQAVELIRDRFERSAGVNYAALFLLDDRGQWARLQHATGQAGRILLERGHKLEVGGNSMVGWATANRRARLALDVGAEPVRFANPLLPHTRSEVALPLVVGDAVLGALDVQSTKSSAFSEADVAVLQTMADQIAVSLQNARLFDQTRRQARREKLVVDITSKLRATTDPETMLKVAVGELRQALGVQHAAVRYGAPPAGRSSTVEVSEGSPARPGGNGNGAQGAGG